MGNYSGYNHRSQIRIDVIGNTNNIIVGNFIRSVGAQLNIVDNGTTTEIAHNIED